MERTIIFVCEHGAAKSMVAVAFFNTLAKERNLKIHALARGTTPDEEHAPSAVQGLANDGLTPSEQKPGLLTKQDITNATAVVSFCDLPDEYHALLPIETWRDVPPVSVDYQKARDVILEHIHHYLDTLEQKDE